MALTTLLPSETNTTTTTTTTTNTHHQHHYHRRRKKKPPPPPPPPPPLRPRTTTTTTSSSWSQLKSLLSCRSSSASAQVHDPSSANPILRRSGPCGPSFCSFRTAATSECGSAASSLRETAPLTVRRRHHQVAAAPGGLRGLSGCYECRAVAVDHTGRYPRRPRTELCTCPLCGEVFTKAESLDHHQATRHAVSELGPEDSGRNIVEIIFKSSWLISRGGRRRPTCQIERILKVHNTARTLASFESYRDAVRLHARSAAATASTRAAADGNELLRFHSARLLCSLGLRGSSVLCTASASGACGVCAAIRHGLLAHHSGSHPESLGVRTTASSGRAHDWDDYCSTLLSSAVVGGTSRAMLVCRVIAGRVRRTGDAPDKPSDSVAAGDCDGIGGNLEELFVANPRAILPCFVVIYRILE